MSIEIRIVEDSHGVERVGIDLGHYLGCLCLTAAQARRLAEWLRIAASPGKTVKEAAFRYRHGGHAVEEVRERENLYLSPRIGSARLSPSLKRV